MSVFFSLYGTHTSDLARAYACKSKARFETAAVAITVLTQRVASERCRCTLAILTRVTPCALVAIIACRALAVCPRARTGASFAPLLETENDRWYESCVGVVLRKHIL